MGSIRAESADEFGASFKVAKSAKSKLSPSLGPEFAAHDGKDDLIHGPILDNTGAETAFQSSAIRRAVARGMNLAVAQQLYGNGLRSTHRQAED